MSLPLKMSFRVSLFVIVVFSFLYIVSFSIILSFLLNGCHAMIFEKLLTTLFTLSTHEISIPTSMHNAHKLFIFKILLHIFCKIYILPNKLMCIIVLGYTLLHFIPLMIYRSNDLEIYVGYNVR